VLPSVLARTYKVMSVAAVLRPVLAPLRHHDVIRLSPLTRSKRSYGGQVWPNSEVA